MPPRGLRKLCVDHAPDRAVDVVVGQALQERQGAGPITSSLPNEVNRRARRARDRPVLEPDALEERGPRPAPPALVGARAAARPPGREVVRALPAVLLAKTAPASPSRASSGSAVARGPTRSRRGDSAACSSTCTTRARARGVRPVLVHGPSAARSARHVVRRLAVDEPVGEDVADRAAGAEPVCERPAATQNPGTPGTGPSRDGCRA